MTRKHYVEFARKIQSLALNKSQREHVARELAEVMAMDNPLFNEEQFLVACGVAQ